VKETSSSNIREIPWDINLLPFLLREEPHLR
jgi:hypothetical protein